MIEYIRAHRATFNSSLLTAKQAIEAGWRPTDALDPIRIEVARYNHSTTMLARALLEERTRVERLEQTLRSAQSFIADGGLAEADPGHAIYVEIARVLAPS
jgi:hypothetical protein